MPSKVRTLVMGLLAMVGLVLISYPASPHVRGEVRYRLWQLLGGGRPFRCGFHSSDFNPSWAFTISGKTFDRPNGRAIEVGEGCVVTFRDCTIRGGVGIFVTGDQFFVNGPRVRVFRGSVEGTEASFLFSEPLDPDESPEVSGETVVSGPVLGDTITILEDPDARARREEQARREAGYAAFACTKSLLECLDEANVTGGIAMNARLHFDANGQGDSATAVTTLEPEALGRCWTERIRKKRIPDFDGAPGTAVCPIGGIHLRGNTGTTAIGEPRWEPDPR